MSDNLENALDAREEGPLSVGGVISRSDLETFKGKVGPRGGRYALCPLPCDNSLSLSEEPHGVVYRLRPVNPEGSWYVVERRSTPQGDQVFTESCSSPYL